MVRKLAVDLFNLFLANIDGNLATTFIHPFNQLSFNLSGNFHSTFHTTIQSLNFTSASHNNQFIGHSSKLPAASKTKAISQTLEKIVE